MSDTVDRPPADLSLPASATDINSITPVPPNAPSAAISSNFSDSQQELAATTSLPGSTAESTTLPQIPPNALVREHSTAIGPSLDQPAPPRRESSATGGPTVLITLLLTNSARHPFKIDERYLRKRNIAVEEMNPFNLSVYALKELIWREWRDEWETRPSSPTSIRLISFGRLLDDKSLLKDCRFNADSPNVVHMTVRPQEIVDEEDAKTTKHSYGRDRDGADRSPGCRCVIL
ncbi:hypothetical protein L228DRAFT_107019 [Xylona heveae TC161]|uniref:UBL3-like ubiquitin domain-containing protein n=1 Tax=Xylona heveae (strain CBS 132557 / TC161) TaxID=1328760 RepID=A0A165HBA9_XYLHT|nr:hypothetical protein L228DRAFT_107019 [Xylona heveae TC161]KZF23249.1 hypothetical protein L228DRAFT_107019 [Xylona heveae TC161]